jgi:hypothetical protein
MSKDSRATRTRMKRKPARPDATRCRVCTVLLAGGQSESMLCGRCQAVLHGATIPPPVTVPRPPRARKPRRTNVDRLLLQVWPNGPGSMPSLAS